MVKTTMSIMPKWLEKEFIIRGIKIIDIGYLTILYFLSGYFVSYYVNKLYSRFDPLEEHDKVKLIIEIIIQLFVIGVIFYVLRNLIPLIPFPLEGISGFKHSLVKELQTGGIALSFGIFNAQLVLKDKMDHLLGYKNKTEDFSSNE